MNRHKYPYEAQQEINDLERKLQKARELVFSAYQEGWYDNKNNLDWETHWIDSDSRYSLDQLNKEGE